MGASSAPKREWEFYFSFFMFTVDLKPDDRDYTEVIVRHIRELTDRGYTGFDLPIAPVATRDHAAEIESYHGLKQALDEAGVGDVGITTNVAATRTFDPSSDYREQREMALAYLKSRVDITKLLGGTIMAGPIVLPYNVFPVLDFGDPIWTDALQEWLLPKYRNAQPVLEELAGYAESQGVKLAIEPVDRWETPAPNMVSEVMTFLKSVPNRQIGVCVDSAHVLLGSDGPEAFAEIARRAGDDGRLHYVHISAPDRGSIRDSWIPYRQFMEPMVAHYDGPLLLETFNAIPAFLASLHLTRRKFWIPGEDQPVDGVPDAYTVASEAIETVRSELAALHQFHDTKEVR